MISVVLASSTSQGIEPISTSMSSMEGKPSPTIVTKVWPPMEPLLGVTASTRNVYVISSLFLEARAVFICSIRGRGIFWTDLVRNVFFIKNIYCRGNFSWHHLCHTDCDGNGPHTNDNQYEEFDADRQAVLSTHWGRVTHICVNKLTIIGSDNGLSPGRRQAIIWTNAGILLIGPLGTNFSEILIEI